MLGCCQCLKRDIDKLGWLQDLLHTLSLFFEPWLGQEHSPKTTRSCQLQPTCSGSPQGQRVEHQRKGPLLFIRKHYFPSSKRESKEEEVEDRWQAQPSAIQYQFSHILSSVSLAALGYSECPFWCLTQSGFQGFHSPKATYFSNQNFRDKLPIAKHIC
jgi:hypothetical protein